MCPRLRGLRRIANALNNYGCSVENLWNSSVDDIHILGLKFYFDGSLDTAVAMSDVLQSETVIFVQRLIGLA